MCPECSSTFLKIRKRTGFERIMIYLTGKRKYWCEDCFHMFRAADRRRFVRVTETSSTGLLPTAAERPA
jgi:hypothetical protein